MGEMWISAVLSFINFPKVWKVHFQNSFLFFNVLVKLVFLNQKVIVKINGNVDRSSSDFLEYLQVMLAKSPVHLKVLLFYLLPMAIIKTVWLFILFLTDLRS